VVARLADAAERRRAGRARGRTVPVDDTGAGAHREALPQFFRRRQQRRGQAEFGGVSDFQRAVEILHAHNLQQRAEPFFVRDALRIGDVDDACGDKAGVRVELAHLQQHLASLLCHLGLRLHQVRGHRCRNHRSHEWLRLGIRRADLQLARHFDQAVDEGLAFRRVLHHQAARASAALAGRNECRHHRMVHGRVDLLHVPHDERIITAHFQRQHLAWLAAELFMQGGAGLAAAGEQHAVDLRLRAECDAGIAAAVHQVQHALRQAGLLPQLHGLHGGARRVFARLEHDRVPGDQGRHDVAVRQVAGEVVGTVDSEHAMRAMAQHGIAVGDLGIRFAGARAVGLDRDIDLVGHGRHFGARFPQRLADFLGNRRGQFFGVFLQQVAEARADGDAFFQRRQGPVLEGAAGGLRGAGDVVFVRLVAGPGLAAGGRIDRDQFRAAAGEPFAVDVVRQVSHCSS